MERSRAKGAHRYDGDGRRTQSEQTRQRIFEHARELVIERGYRGMTIAEVARRAGVHIDTVYELAGRKPVILQELVERAISGTDRPLDPLERDYVQQMRSEPDAGNKLDLYAAAMRRIHARLAPLFLALRDAARTDPEAAAVWTKVSERRAANMRLLAADVAGSGQLRPELGIQDVADTIWVTNSPEVHQLLITDRGWTPEQYESWLAGLWRRALLPDDQPDP